MKKVIGMDGGGTSLKTTLVGDNIHSSFSYDLGVNVSAVSEDTIREALERVRSDTGRVDSIVAAFAGAGDPVRSSKIMRVVKAIFPEATAEVISDLEGLHRACFGDKPGVVVVSGTGAGAFGRDHSGNFHRAGGWGHLFDDEGSAFWISTQIICHALRFRDGFPDFAVVMAYEDNVKSVLESVEDIYDYLNGLNRVRIGLGAFKLLERPSVIEEMIIRLRSLSPDEITLFSLRSLKESAALKNLLKRMFAG